jgi:RNA polymerase sigma-70 factor, ECF subfamily
MLVPHSPAQPSLDTQSQWLAKFHQGDHETLAMLYQDHFATVYQAVGAILHGGQYGANQRTFRVGTDHESIVHDIFARLVGNAAMRQQFTGGSISAWLRTISRNQAIDVYRRRKRERTALQSLAIESSAASDIDEPSLAPNNDAACLAHIIEQFKQHRLPAKWHAAFNLLIVRQLSQRQAAASLGISRTTIAYQDLRIRALLRAFVLKEYQHVT